MSLQKLFYPTSVAVIGASNNLGKLGHSVTKNIINSGYSGTLLPVNPKESQILGLTVQNSIINMPTPDVSIFVIPGSFVKQAMIELVANKKGSIETTFAIIISAGFREIGNEELELEVIEIAKGGNIQVVGPNCLGLINKDNGGYNGSFAYLPKNVGGISLYSQSGAIVTAFLDKADTEGVGFNKIISMGNCGGLNEADLLNYFNEDKATKVISMYIEGLKNPLEFVQAIKNSKKPVIILKAGRSEKTQEAMASHTGSVAGSAKVTQMMLKNAGAIVVETISDFFQTLVMFEKYSTADAQGKLAIITNAGGPGVLCVDYCDDYNLNIEHLDQDLQDELAPFLTAEASTQNPIDLVGDAKLDRYENALRIVTSSKDTNQILVLLTPQTVTQITETAQAIIDYSNKFPNKIILPVFIGGDKLTGAIELFKQNQIPYFSSPEFAIKTLATYNNWVNRDQSIEVEEVFDLAPDLSEIRASLVGKPDTDYFAAQALCTAFEVRMPYYAFVTKETAIAKFDELRAKGCEKFVLKVVSAHIKHRTVDMVKVGATTAMEALEFTNKFDGEEMILQEMAPSGPEVFIGIQKDDQFGNQLVIGTGGVYAELYDDFVLLPSPKNKDQIRKAFAQTKIYQVLNGYRDRYFDFEFVVDSAWKLCQMMNQMPEIVSLDVNPLIAQKQGGFVVDFKAIMSQE